MGACQKLRSPERQQIQSFKANMSLQTNQTQRQRRASAIKTQFGQVKRPQPQKKSRKNPQYDYRAQVQDDSQEAPTAVIENRVIQKIEKQLIIQTLAKHSIFANLSKEQQKVVISKMQHFTINRGELVFSEGQLGHYFFIVKSGKLYVIVNEKPVKTLEAGDSFGELALIQNAPRSASVRTADQTELWALDRDSFQLAIRTLNASNFEENLAFLNKVPLFDSLTEHQKELLVSSFSVLKYKDREKIIREGEIGNLFYIIKEGTVMVTVNERDIRQMSKGSFFGEQALLHNQLRTATITALGSVKCLALSREDLAKSLGTNLQEIIYQNSKRMAVDKSQYLNILTEQQKDTLVSMMTLVEYQKGNNILTTSNIKGQRLIIVLKGRIISKQTGSTIASLHQCIGDIEIVSSNNMQYYEEDYIAEDDVLTAELESNQFETAIGGDYETITKNNEIFKMLKQVQLLKSVPHEKLQELVKVIISQDFVQGDVIVRENDPGEAFFIIKNGNVEIFKGDTLVRTITKNDYFGERVALFSIFRSATVVAASPIVSC